MAISVTNLRAGVVFEEEGEIYQVSRYLHQKYGRGSAIIKVDAKNIRTGKAREFRFSSGSQVQDADVEKKPLEFIYFDERNNHLILSDPETKKRMTISADFLEKSKRQFLKSGVEVTAVVLGEEEDVISLEIPLMVSLVVTETGPSDKGDSAASVTKAATLETGAVIQVPMFIKTDDVLRINTELGSYVERAKG